MGGGGKGLKVRRGRRTRGAGRGRVCVGRSVCVVVGGVRLASGRKGYISSH